MSTLHKPNILIFMSDDQGPWAMNCAGTPELRTPNLNRLAEEGIRFENFFCASPVCSPARASFLTGRIPSQHGVHDWICHGNIVDPENRTGGGPDTRIEYLEGLTAFTDVLAGNGYSCGLSGKWHLGASDVPQKSHEFWCVHSRGGDNYTNYWVYDNSTEVVNKTQYVTDFFTDRAIDYLDSRKGNAQPFCLSVHYTAPHAPWKQEEQPADIWDSYADTEFSLPVEPPHPWRGWDPTPEARHRTIQGYYTTITAMDRAIGRVLDKLDALGMAEDTIVIFTSDNGYSVGHHGILHKGNGTFPLNLLEASVKVPFIARFPGHFEAGTVNSDLVSHYDFMPTLLDYLGFENPEADKLPGRSFAKVLRGEALNWEDEGIVICDEYGPNRMFRTKEWKYNHRYPDGPHELYHLAEDPKERVNLLDDPAHADVQDAMCSRLDQWFEKYVTPERDGAALYACKGRGQRDLVGKGASGVTVFEPRDDV
ncbi:MAG: sulfatase-like hydrolase/transferase [Verrucomicrobia bacterium]|jgi:choline-sulfatase|nr:sulfatase-like hydrolase/transferase [Verrucomicrobiota bacterium]MBT7067061.1 sulfatase-like hydrolase/transferase [Verrucomicrobiota bacterium]MBT7700021.1 sulfatase-like hydrolase/transferase [Verrucomicrobiota bacterium]